MDSYVTGAVIRRLREERNMTQEELAQKICVSGKAVSKWETGRGLPDVSLLEPLAAALGISVAELFSGETVRNRNRSANMLKSRFYLCPVCGNVIRTIGEAAVSCCGIALPPLEAEEADAEHAIQAETAEDEYYVRVAHPMTKEHYITFLAAVSDQGMQFVKLYPEGGAEAYFRRSRVRALYACCSRHGLFRLDVRKTGGKA
ncbi:MAG: helix-turn-helix domain-containing protein [Lachnospiraceae bacterium]|nr:helix-turn-helix domain-containing protein [Lachnospiraceae bacterium]